MKLLAFHPYHLKLWRVWTDLNQYQFLLMYKILWFHSKPRRIQSTQVGTKTPHIRTSPQFPRFHLQLWKSLATQVSSFQTPLTTSLQLTRYFAKLTNIQLKYFNVCFYCFTKRFKLKIFRPFFSLGSSPTSV